MEATSNQAGPLLTYSIFPFFCPWVEVQERIGADAKEAASWHYVARDSFGKAATAQNLYLDLIGVE